MWKRIRKHAAQGTVCSLPLLALVSSLQDRKALLGDQYPGILVTVWWVSLIWTL